MVIFLINIVPIVVILQVLITKLVNNFIFPLQSKTPTAE